MHIRFFAAKTIRHWWEQSFPRCVKIVVIRCKRGESHASELNCDFFIVLYILLDIIIAAGRVRNVSKIFGFSDGRLAWAWMTTCSCERHGESMQINRVVLHAHEPRGRQAAGNNLRNVIGSRKWPRKTCERITLCCTVVDSMSVAGTKAAIPEMLENALEHEILHEG